MSFPEISVYPPFAPLQDCAPSTSDVFFLFSFDTLAAFQKDGISRLGVHGKEAQEPDDRRLNVQETDKRVFYLFALSEKTYLKDFPHDL